MTDGSRMAIAGDSTSVAGFRTLGFATFAVSRPEDAVEHWPLLSSGEFGAVFVTEPVWEALGKLTEDVRDRSVPAVTVIPGAGSAGGVGAEKLAKAIERALGTSALIGEEEG